MLILIGNLFIHVINLKSLIFENIDIINTDELDPEHYDQLNQMVAESGIHILSDKELDRVYLSDGKVAAGLWTSVRNDIFSFDVIVGENYRNKGLGARVIRDGIQMYRELAGDFDVTLKLDVVNSKLVEPLKKIGLIIQHVENGHTIMGYDK